MQSLHINYQVDENIFQVDILKLPENAGSNPNS